MSTASKQIADMAQPEKAYFLQARPDIAELIPLQAHRILDIGCGFGGLGKFLVETRGSQVDGVERSREADQYLNTIYDHFVIGDVETAADQFAGRQYDCIVFADILEHLVDPWSTLRRYSQLLAPDGVIVASIPNVRNLILLLKLLIRGRWQYTTSGLLDRTHLRFFTKPEINELFQQAGLLIQRVEVNRDHYNGALRVLSWLPRLFAPDFTVCQFKVVARRPNRNL